MKHLLPLIILILTFSIQIFALDYTVNLITDQHDPNTADNLCDVSSGTAGLQCSLRAAVEQANAHVGDDRILFDLPPNSTITLTTGNGGEITINSDKLEILGTGANNLTIDGGTGNNRIFFANQAIATISGMTLTGGNAISANENGHGGAIYALKGLLTINGVHITGNSTIGGGGGVRLERGTYYFINSTISNNTTNDVCGGLAHVDSSLTVVNTTISGNTATYSGGGLCNLYGNTILRNVTITNNNANIGFGGGGIYQAGGKLDFGNTIIAGNNTGNGNFSEIRHTTEVSNYNTNTITSGGGNLIGDSAGDSTSTDGVVNFHSTDIRDTNPLLGTLQNNGGTTPTRALLASSPAIDKGLNSLTLEVTDQRGATRIQDGNGDGTAIIDIGAYEAATVINQCTYSLSTTDIFIAPAGSAAGAVLTTQTGCVWTATSNVPWILVTGGASGNGSGTINFTVATNTGASRIGTITIGGQTLVISQTSGCTYSISRSEDFIEAHADGRNFSVSAGPGCAWTAVSNNSWITIGGNPNGNGNGSVSYTVAANTGSSRTGSITVAGHTFIVNQQAVVIPSRRTQFDYDGDGKSDFSIYRPSVGEWWYQRSSNGGNAAAQFGTATDKIVPADYTGDRKTDFAFYRPSTGEWFILRSEDFSYYAFPFGALGDIPAPADYDGDGKDDPAVYRPSARTWYILKSTGGVRIEQHGGPGELPIPADYDGDGRTDLRTAFNAIGGKFVVADYTGDGKADMASYDPLNGMWNIQRSDDASFYQVKFGISGDIAVPADYDGDGKTDIAIFRPSTTDWWYMASSAGGEARTVRFGVSTDIPVPSAYVR